MGKRVIIDTDPGIDDALALMLALKSDELHIEAVTTVSGNVSLEQATKNAALLLELLNPSPRPLLGAGSERPREKAAMKSQSVHGSDGLGGLHRFRNRDGTPRYPEPSITRPLPDAIEILFDLVNRYPEELTLITLGPLTNLAQALAKDANQIKRLREVISMGGAIKVPGNVTPAAEFNILTDPHGAQRVFESGLPMTLVPLDVTEKVRLTAEDIHELGRDMDEPWGALVSHITGHSMDHMSKIRGVSGIYLHDPLAVGVAIDPMMVVTSPLHVAVETGKGITRGMTLADTRSISKQLKHPANLHVALEVESERFRTFFKERLCRRSW